MSDVRYVHQHFDRPAKFGWFTPFEWALVALAGLTTTVWWRYVSPFGFSGTATTAIVLNAPLYVYAQLKDGRGARGLVVRLRVIWSWHTAPRRGRGGGASKARGYSVAPGAIADADGRPPEISSPDLRALWD